MPRAEARATIARPPAAVWAVVSSFDEIHLWHPLIADCVPEPGVPPGTPGHLRRLTTTDGGEILERLLQLDDGVCGYEFAQSPFPVSDYRATLRITPGPTEGTSEVRWWADFTPLDPAETDSLRALFTDNVFVPGLKALDEHLARPAP
ncbi:SRPBCC family protein [Streptomyces daliensis]